MRFSTITIVSIAICAALPAKADVYRCVGELGEPEFRQQPCGTTAVQVTAASDSPVGGLRPGERAWLAQRSERRTGARPDAGKSAAQAQQRRRRADKQAYQCVRKQRSLQQVEADMRRGYRAGKGEQLRRRRQAYQDYLASFCSS